LLIEVVGPPAGLAEEADRVAALCRQHGAIRVHAAQDAAKRDRVWSARRRALPALTNLKPTAGREASGNSANGTTVA